MKHTTVIRFLLGLAFVVTVGGGWGMYRFYLTSPELRLPELEARLHLVPTVAILLLIVVGWLLVREQEPPSPPSSLNRLS
ncbi:MAG: hypothetical protein WEA04_03605 [Candidatus Andersenbacteria bacterium]